MTDQIAMPCFLYQNDRWRLLKETTLSGYQQPMHVAVHEQPLSFYADGSLRRWTCRAIDEEPQRYSKIE
jgi:hypothetical protein